MKIISLVKDKYRRYKKLKGIKKYRKMKYNSDMDKFLAYCYYVGGEGKLEDLYKLFGPELVRRAFFVGYINVYDGLLGWKDHLYNTDAYKKYDNRK